MPATYTNSLRGSAFPQFRASFHFTNDPAEDDEFIAFALATLAVYYQDVDMVYRNVIIDRTGTPAFQWEQWEQVDGEWVQVGNGSKTIGTADSFWRSNASRFNLGIAPLDMNIYFECDERGRALSIDSLVVP